MYNKPAQFLFIPTLYFETALITCARSAKLFLHARLIPRQTFFLSILTFRKGYIVEGTSEYLLPPIELILFRSKKNYVELKMARIYTGIVQIDVICKTEKSTITPTVSDNKETRLF